ncbi:Protein SOSEKI 1 [Savitreella phatthalungensis]
MDHRRTSTLGQDDLARQERFSMQQQNQPSREQNHHDQQHQQPPQPGPSTSVTTTQQQMVGTPSSPSTWSAMGPPAEVPAQSAAVAAAAAAVAASVIVVGSPTLGTDDGILMHSAGSPLVRCTSPGKRPPEYVGADDLLHHVNPVDGMKRLRLDGKHHHHRLHPGCPTNNIIIARHTQTTSETTGPFVRPGTTVPFEALTRVAKSAGRSRMRERDPTKRRSRSLPDLHRCHSDLSETTTPRESIERLRERLTRPLEPVLFTFPSYAVDSNNHQLRHQSYHRSSSRRSTSLVPPPVCMATLHELDWSEIELNAQLRHDAVHDPNLQFRPNTDGERGLRKRYESDRYWKSVARELERISSLFLPQQRRHTKLYLVLRELRDILRSFMHASDRRMADEHFDVHLIMQMMHYGVFDVHAFTIVVTDVMRRYCAPKRDLVLDHLVQRAQHLRCTPASSLNSAYELADLLRSAFDALEMMKLDVANHELVMRRPQLLASALEFQQAWFTRKFATGVLCEVNAVSWLVKPDDATEPARFIEILFAQRTIDLMLGCASARQSSATGSVSRADLPHSWTFDAARLTGISRELRRIVHLQIVLLLVRQLATLIKLDDAAFTTIADEVRVLLRSDEIAAGEIGSMEQSESMLAVLSDPLGVTRDDAIDSIAVQVAVRSGCKEKVDFARSWLTQHLSSTSPIFRMVQTRLATLLSSRLARHLLLGDASHNGQVLATMTVDEAAELAHKAMPDPTHLVHTVLKLSPQEATANAALQDTHQDIAQAFTKLLATARFHFRVHEHRYAAAFNATRHV